MVWSGEHALLSTQIDKTLSQNKFTEVQRGEKPRRPMCSKETFGHARKKQLKLFRVEIAMP